MSGVKSLRAKFEPKGDSLPDRGRLPGPGGFGTPSPSASPRPLSKVRTSFVAVEKDGRIGLRREPSGDSVSVSSRRHSNDTDATTPQPLSDRTDIFADNMSTNVASFKSNLSHEAIPESPRQDTPVKFSPKKEEKHAPLEPNANPDKVTDEEEPQTKMLAGNPSDASATRLGGTVLNEGISDALNGASAAATSAKTPNSAGKSTSKMTTTTSKTTAKAVKPATATKTATATKEPVKTAKPAAAKATATSADSKKLSATKTAATKPTPIDLPPSGTGFVKPKPKSPTRPVKLPASLTTHTAASAQKFGNGSATSAPRQSLSRASGNAQHLSVSSTAHRSPSRNSVSTAATATKTLKHKPSSANVSRPRPSIGPPPKPASRDSPAAKRDSHVDEGFLARMMRPTQSSSHKTADKAPVTPPRKQAAPVKKPEPKEAEKNANKVAAKIQASSKAKPTKETTKPAAAKTKPTAKEIAPAVAQTETAEEAINEAKLSTETAEPAPVEEQKAEASTKEEPTAKEIAPTVAQAETAEEAIEEAKLSADTAEPALVEEKKREAAATPEANLPSDGAHIEEQKADIEPAVGEQKAETANTEESPLETAEEGIEEQKSDEEKLPVATETHAEEQKADAEPGTKEAEAEAVAEPPVTTKVDAAGSKETVPSVPVVNEDPDKVEDIEDVVQGVQPSQPEAAESTAEPQQPIDEKTQAKEPQSADDLKAEDNAVEARNGDVVTETP